MSAETHLTSTTHSVHDDVSPIQPHTPSHNSTPSHPPIHCLIMAHLVTPHTPSQQHTLSHLTNPLTTAHPFTPHKPSQTPHTLSQWHTLSHPTHCLIQHKPSHNSTPSHTPHTFTTAHPFKPHTPSYNAQDWVQCVSRLKFTDETLKCVTVTLWYYSCCHLLSLHVIVPSVKVVPRTLSSDDIDRMYHCEWVISYRLGGGGSS